MAQSSAAERRFVRQVTRETLRQFRASAFRSALAIMSFEAARTNCLAELIRFASIALFAKTLQRFQCSIEALFGLCRNSSIAVFVDEK